MDYRIFPPEDILQTTVKLPLSKSIANRALAIAALTNGGGIRPDTLPECDDTRVMLDGIDAPSGTEADCHGAGTAMRFLTAVTAATPGLTRILTGDSRLCQRPISPLVDALRLCGASIEYLGKEGFPPVKVTGKKLIGGDVAMPASTSSQFVSALLMAAPAMEHGIRLTLEGDIVSEPYITLTIAMIERAAATVTRDGATITVSPGEYQPVMQPAEADWSAAAFWYEIEALTSGFVSLDRLDPTSLQPDRAAATVFEALGVNTDFDGDEGFTDLLASPDLSPRLYLDFSAMPDLVPAVTVTCCLLRIPFRFTGLSTLRIKECDRIAILCREMARLGIILDTEGESTLYWEGKVIPVTEMPEFDPAGDHRMAMALAPVALYLPGIVIKDAGTVAKSYPGYWDHLRQAGFTLKDAAQTLSEKEESK